MRYFLKLTDESDVEVDRVTYVRVNIKSALQLLETANSLADQPALQLEFLKASKINLDKATKSLTENS
jgi:hypothetical protein